MKITDITCEEIYIPLKKPFRISYGTQRAYKGVIIKIDTDENISGLGEAPISPHITGDTISSITGAIEIFKELLLGENPLLIPKLIGLINNSILYNYSAKKAVDNALYDILTKVTGITVREMLGASLQQLETSLTVSIGTRKDCLRDAEALIEMGAKVIKAKIGLSPKEDIDRVKALCSNFDVPVRLDANGGYTLKEAIHVLRELEGLNIQFIEQPVRHDLYEELGELRKQTIIPVMADESVRTCIDLLRVIDHVDMVNIKLAKTGGIHEAVIMANILKKKNKKFMVGCMIETKLSIAAGLNFSLGVGADYIDLDGFIDLETQVHDDLVTFRDGFLSL